MKRTDRIKLDFTRNWKLPGKERLANWLKPSRGFKSAASNGITWLTTENIAIYASPDSYIEWTILSNGTYEDEINKLIRISLKEGENALDIGANIGLQSIRMSQCVGKSGKVVAFEPLDHLREKFLKNTGLNKADNILLLPYALANDESEADFTIDKNAWNQGTFSLSNKSGGLLKQRVLIKVGDDIPEIQRMRSIDFVKIDVEGFEYPVILGLKKMIEKHLPRIVFEYDAAYWANNGQKIGDCYAFLQSLNYTVYQVRSVGCELIKAVENIVGGNLFCIQNNL